LPIANHARVAIGSRVQLQMSTREFKLKNFERLWNNFLTTTVVYRAVGHGGFAKFNLVPFRAICLGAF
jgi:hypothetical protein